MSRRNNIYICPVCGMLLVAKCERVISRHIYLSPDGPAVIGGTNGEYDIKIECSGDNSHAIPDELYGNAYRLVNDSNILDRRFG